MMMGFAHRAKLNLLLLRFLQGPVFKRYFTVTYQSVFFAENSRGTVSEKWHTTFKSPLICLILVVKS